MKVPQTPIEVLTLRMEKLGIHPDDLVEKFIRGTGAGGQKINKTSSCVYLHHLPSGTEIKCQQGRSRAKNRLLARQLLCEYIESIAEEKRLLKLRDATKIRNEKRPRSAGQKEKMLKNKHLRSKAKQTRKKVNSES